MAKATASATSTTVTTSSQRTQPQVEISQFHHTPYYCEENVYMLCKKLSTLGMAEADASDLFIVFISNENKQVPLWHQKAGKRGDGLVLWDYHVICIQRNSGNSPPLVWDIDSDLPFPSPLGSYASEAIGSSFQLFPEYQRFFRIVHAPLFLQHFASDRRHMKNTDGSWIYPPPGYEPITAADGAKHNLNDYMEIHGSEVISKLSDDSINGILSNKLGVVTNEHQLEEFLHLIFSAMEKK